VILHIQRLRRRRESMKKPLARLSFAAILALVTGVPAAQATIAPRQGVKFPKGFREQKERVPTAFTYTRALQPLVRRLQANRMRLAAGLMSAEAAAAAGGTAIAGSRSIPVLLAKFSNTGAEPYPNSTLQKELFDGPWPTGTMTDFYKEISYGRFAVTGTVVPWKALSQNDTFYEGTAGCNGVCPAAHLADFLKSTLDANDPSLDFSQYDNDGPDNVPNSGDDDGYVDFVAFVHPESGGECGNSNIWSHRWSYSGWTGSDYTTNDARNGGGFIKVNDYVIMPALACNGSTMIQIGVFAHEFGHAFGLPDLYDTDDTNGTSEGIGNWCLMAAGSWGGDGQSPERPTHMSAWCKEFLGWVSPTLVTSDQTPASLLSVEDNAAVLRIAISNTQYYLIENRQKKLFDLNLPTGGLAIWHINETAVSAGLANNTVNADENNKGVDLEEADGRADLDNAVNRGDAGDLFPGSENRTDFDNSTNPRSTGQVAVCGVSASGSPMTANVLTSMGKCRGNCSQMGGVQGRGGMALRATLLGLPLLLAWWLSRARRRPVAETP
jgi:M6 family metalloprotease-like protein